MRKLTTGSTISCLPGLKSTFPATRKLCPTQYIVKNSQRSVPATYSDINQARYPAIYLNTHFNKTFCIFHLLFSSHPKRWRHRHLHGQSAHVHAQHEQHNSSDCPHFTRPFLSFGQHTVELHHNHSKGSC